MVPTILDLGTIGGEWSTSCSDSFTSPHPGKGARHTLDRRLGGLQSRSGPFREKSLSSAGNITPVVQRVAIPTEVSWLCHITGPK
jgi:hypothetical protein